MELSEILRYKNIYRAFRRRAFLWWILVAFLVYAKRKIGAVEVVMLFFPLLQWVAGTWGLRALYKHFLWNRIIPFAKNLHDTTKMPIVYCGPKDFLECRTLEHLEALEGKTITSIRKLRQKFLELRGTPKMSETEIASQFEQLADNLGLDVPRRQELLGLIGSVKAKDRATSRKRELERELQRIDKELGALDDTSWQEQSQTQKFKLLCQDFLGLAGEKPDAEANALFQKALGAEKWREQRRLLVDAIELQKKENQLRLVGASEPVAAKRSAS